VPYSPPSMPWNWKTISYCGRTEAAWFSAACYDWKHLKNPLTTGSGRKAVCRRIDSVPESGQPVRQRAVVLATTVPYLFDDVVGGFQQFGWNRYSQFVGGPLVDSQLTP
jgi:hypothetical protein